MKRDLDHVPYPCAVLCGLWTLALIGLGSTSPALYLLPAVLIFVPLLLGRHPGEATLLRLAGRRRHSRPLRAPGRIGARRPVAPAARSASRLLVISFPSRGPPCGPACR